MNTLAQTTEQQVKAFCARIGADPLLVQGAGGNISWKDGDTLWVKASGTWLAQAKVKDIFVPVDLSSLQLALSTQLFSVTPKTIGESSLRPSIETLLHALMPHKVVAHLHAIEILAYLVRANPEEEFDRVIGDAVKWGCVDYFKPGAELAEAVAKLLAKATDVDVVFLRNHGVVIGGKNVEQIENTLSQLLSALRGKLSSCVTDPASSAVDAALKAKGYSPSDDQEINQLAINEALSSRLQSEWALYPDHVVFLGEEASIVEQLHDSSDLDNAVRTNPPFIFVIGQGVFESQSVTDAHKAQLRCYYDVLVRQKASEKLISLNKSQIGEILNWDAEKYRQNTSSDKSGIR
ncbi:MAG: class II aldolase/adducin family protein [Pseudomonadota bacterium]